MQEFQYCFNGRENQDLITLTVAALALGAPLPYDKLVGETRIIHNVKGVNQFTKNASGHSTETETEEPF